MGESVDIHEDLKQMQSLPKYEDRYGVALKLAGLLLSQRVFGSFFIQVGQGYLIPDQLINPDKAGYFKYGGDAITLANRIKVSSIEDLAGMLAAAANGIGFEIKLLTKDDYLAIMGEDEC